MRRKRIFWRFVNGRLELTASGETSDEDNSVGAGLVPARRMYGRINDRLSAIGAGTSPAPTLIRSMIGMTASGTRSHVSLYEPAMVIKVSFNSFQVGGGIQKPF